MLHYLRVYILYSIISYHVKRGVYNTYFVICINLHKATACLMFHIMWPSCVWGPYYDAGRPLWCLQLAGKVHPNWMVVVLDSANLPRILVEGWLIIESLGPMLFESKSKSFRWVPEQDCISILSPAKSRKSFFSILRVPQLAEFRSRE